MLSETVKLQLASGYRRPETYEEVAWQEKFRKPDAVIGTGFPGLTPEEYAMCLTEKSEVIGVESAPTGKFRVILVCGHSALHDMSVDKIEDFLPGDDGTNATTTCYSCNPEDRENSAGLPGIVAGWDSLDGDDERDEELIEDIVQDVWDEEEEGCDDEPNK